MKLINYIKLAISVRQWFLAIFAK